MYCENSGRGARATGDYIAVGDDATAAPANSTPISDAIHSDTAKTAATAALVYHGYRRTGSIFWALAYGLVGHAVPVVAVPVAIAQGFGKRKICTTE
jgi:hypothetical protein